MFEGVCEHCDCFADCVEYEVDADVRKELCLECVVDVEKGVWIVDE